MNTVPKCSNIVFPSNRYLRIASDFIASDGLQREHFREGKLSMAFAPRGTGIRLYSPALSGSQDVTKIVFLDVTELLPSRTWLQQDIAVPVDHQSMRAWVAYIQDVQNSRLEYEPADSKSPKCFVDVILVMLVRLGYRGYYLKRYSRCNGIRNVLHHPVERSSGASNPIVLCWICADNLDCEGHWDV